MKSDRVEEPASVIEGVHTVSARLGKDEESRRKLRAAIEVLVRAQRSPAVEVLSVAKAEEGYKVELGVGKQLDFEGEYTVVRWDDELED